MEIINRTQRMRSVCRKVRRDQDRTIGLVPTMGALHEGHLSLVREARRMCDTVVISIFVNPKQFTPKEDFQTYPRDLTKDTMILADYNVDYIFAPPVEEIYPKGFSTHVEVEGLSDQLEGAARPGHFRGVATVLTILFNIVRPDFAYFGQKDAQQSLIVRRMMRDLAFDTEIVILPTVREETGLAFSSRNAYLTDDERRAAPVLHRALAHAESAYGEGERNAKKLVELVRADIERAPQAQVEYISVNDADTLAPLERLEDRPVLISLAVRFGKTRLIDNTVLNRTRTGKTGALTQP
jgi:pantoate--beta-alanine ligase